MNLNKKKTEELHVRKKWGSKQIKICVIWNGWCCRCCFFLGRTISFIGMKKKTFVYRLHSVCSVYLWKALERKQKRKVEIIRTKEAEEKNGWNYFIDMESLCYDFMHNCCCVFWYVWAWGMVSAVNNFVDTPYLIKWHDDDDSSSGGGNSSVGVVDVNVVSKTTVFFFFFHSIFSKPSHRHTLRQRVYKFFPK